MDTQPPLKKRSVGSSAGRTHLSTNYPAHEIHIDRLPPKLLQRVFSLVGPQELLTSASRVCRRWQRLALSPQLWGRVCVRYEEVTDRPWTPETHPPKDAEEALWVHIVDRKRVGELQAILERAPCLRHLQLSVKENLPEAVESALVAARRVPVESLALLQSNAASLRVLEWRQPKNLEKWDYFVKELDPLEEEDEATAAWRLIATGMPRLEQLAVDWTWKEETDDLFSTDGRRLAVPRRGPVCVAHICLVYIVHSCSCKKIFFQGGLYAEDSAAIFFSHSCFLWQHVSNLINFV
ncbi:hypothetical protein FOCC_FOCC013934 [Frankliniella occidentalis]|nr:hypothetical protein FOCC_FOCC013934 [Frankliniella occidentalis]